MFTLRDRRTGELFDRRSDFGDKRRRLMEQSWAGVFRNHLLVELPVDDLCRHLDERMGRPSKDLHVVIGVLLLQQLHDLSDAETVEALAFNMAWHYALDVRSEADSYFCEKTLRNYRRLFIEQGLDELLFRCLTDRLVQGFSVDTSHQRMDSTALRSAMRALTIQRGSTTFGLRRSSSKSTHSRAWPFSSTTFDHGQQPALLPTCIATPTATMDEHHNSLFYRCFFQFPFCGSLTRHRSHRTTIMFFLLKSTS